MDHRFRQIFRRGKSLLAVLLAGCAVVLAFPASGQTPPPATAQIGPGSTGSISHGVSKGTGDKPHEILQGALSPKTRQTLQQAMNASTTATPAK
jgi:hypothetical protein